MMHNRHSTAGFTMIEVLFSAAFVLMFVTVLISAYIIYFQLSIAGPKHTAAIFLADEGIEAVRVVRDSGWEEALESIETGEEYYFEFIDGAWSLTQDSDYAVIDDTFTRIVEFSEVYRDEDDEIAETGVLDEDTLKARVVVTWDGVISESSRELFTYTTNMFKEEDEDEE